MKKLTAAAALICVIFWLNKSVSNPIVAHIINELLFDSTGWELELYDYFSERDTLDTWCLITGTDTAYFKDGITFNEEGYLVITQDSLQNKIDINPEGDIISLYDTSFFYDNSPRFIDHLRFGPSGWISAPKIGQSIRISPYESDEYLLDNSPTIGNPNDSTNITGFVEGYIKDSLNNAIPEVKVIYGYHTDDYGFSWISSVITNSIGYYSFNELSKQVRLEFEKDGFYEPDTIIQVWPDSTVIVNIEMSIVVGITEITPATLNEFELTQNFPNPFNSSTSFFYFLPEDEELEIIIYDQKGEIVQRLFKGFQSKGQYRINWNANEMASGIYFYELKTSSRKFVKKCLLLK
jgi:hypothetical protein